MQYQHILGATDFSPLGDLALRRAAGLAVESGAKLTAMTVLPQPQMPSPLISHYEVKTDPGRRERAREAAVAALEERLASALGEATLEVEYVVRVGDPADEILWADGQLSPDLIVLATHGRRGLQRFLMGSVCERVVQLAEADVLAVRERLEPADE